MMSSRTILTAMIVAASSLVFPACMPETEPAPGQTEVRLSESGDPSVIGLSCRPEAVTILEATEEGARFSRRVLPEEIDMMKAAARSGDAVSQSGDVSAQATPFWCDNKPCWGCAGTCWFGGKPTYFEGKTKWVESSQTCYCEGYGNFWNCCP